MQRSREIALMGERTAFILFTDIHRSTQLWERYPVEFKELLHQHNVVTEEAARSNGCEVLKNLGDGYLAVFGDLARALSCAVIVQREFTKFPPLPDENKLLLRIAMHAGTPHRLPGADEYFGPILNRCSRICQVCHPGQVLFSAAVKELMEGPPAEGLLIDLGEHRLRDLSQPERLYQLDHPEFALHEFPPLPTLGNRPNNLVYQPNEFIGRAREMEELRELLLEKKQRLVTITAPGGYGKSRLATQLCANLLQEYQYGVFEVLLAPVGDAGRVVGATADALGFQFYSNAAPKDQLIGYLREKEMLLSFDNFEHVLTGKDLVIEILQQAPKVSILATSREPLRLKAEKVYRLEPLPVASDTKEKAAGEDLPEAVQLFIDRASLVNHEFALTEENLATIGEICTTLDGVPLAVELAAGWADSFTLSEMLEEVSEQLELTARMDDVPDRQRSIRASLDWSYGLLSEEQRRVLRAVSVFKGGFFLDAAAALIQDKGLRRTLAELCDKGWLFSREALGKTRFFVRDAAARQYAFERLWESDELEPAVLAHASHFSKLIAGEGAKLKRHGQLDAVRTIRLEIENIRVGVACALDRKDAGLLLPFAEHLAQYFNIVSKWQEGLPLYKVLLSTAIEIDDELLIEHSLVGRAILDFELRNIEEAREAVSQLEQLARASRTQRVMAFLLNCRGVLAHTESKYDMAERFLQEGLELYTSAGDQVGMASSFNDLAVTAWRQGKIEDSLALHNRSLSLGRELGDLYSAAKSLNYLGLISLATEDYTKARNYIDESLAIERELGDRAGIGVSLGLLGGIALRQSDYATAEKLLEESMRISREIGDRSGIAIALYQLATCARYQGKHEKAEQLYLEGLIISRDISHKLGTVLSLRDLGCLFIELERFTEARTLLSKALEISAEIEGKHTRISTVIRCGDMWLKLERWNEAGVALFGAKRHTVTDRFILSASERNKLEDKLATLERRVPADKLAEAKAKAEKMSLEELGDFTLRTLVESGFDEDTES